MLKRLDGKVAIVTGGKTEASPLRSVASVFPVGGGLRPLAPRGGVASLRSATRTSRGRKVPT